MKPQDIDRLRASAALTHAFYSDLVGYNARRSAILKHFWITQKITTRGDREMTYLYVENRKATRPALFLHGAPGNAMDWEKFLFHPHDFSICALDRPGYGPTPQGRPDMERDIDMVGDVLGDLSSEQKVVLVGHSLGAGIAARLAADFPGSVERLVLVGASLVPEPESLQTEHEKFSRFPRKLFITRSIRHAGHELRQYDDFLRDLQPRLADIKCPVAMVHAKDDGFVPFENVAYGREHFTGTADFQAITTDKGGHYLNLKRPDLILKGMRGDD